MHDLIIIGAGPAGLSAGIYAKRYKLNTAIIDSSFGGTIKEAHLIENYPGFEAISGLELAEKLLSQARRYNLEFIQEEVKRIENKDGQFGVFTEKEEYKAKAVILAMGMKHKSLNINGEKEFLGKGVSYCLACDAPFFEGKTAAVIGGANSACSGALFLSRYAKKIYLIYRKDKLRAEPIIIEQINKAENIEVIYSANPKEIKGKQFVESILLDNGKEIKADGVFVMIGAVPAHALLKNIKVDKEGYIITDKNKAANVEGVFAAGDITSDNAISCLMRLDQRSF
ncbi:FAD-dependent oxidoreductase [archaeon]|nr:FAD-dependent oxidoreductase [archaeon]